MRIFLTAGFLQARCPSCHQTSFKIF